MQTKHTLEPWKIVGKITSPIPADFYPILIGCKDEEGDLPLCAVHNEDSGSDARRIVACVNACAGIPIEALEDGSARAERDDIAEQLECATIMRHGWECAIERCCEAVQEVITQTHSLPRPDLEVVGLKELLEEVAKADAALSAGDTNEALNKVRTASAVASLIKSHVANRPLFRSPRPDLVAEIERLSEKCRDSLAQNETDAGIIKSDGKEIHFLRQQLSAAQADSEQLVKALNNLIPLAKVGNYDGRKEITDAEALAAHKARQQPPAKVQFDALMKGENAESPIERLRFFLSLALNGQDWLDVETFIAAIENQQAPEGYVLVPIEPTTAIKQAMCRVILDDEEEQFCYDLSWEEASEIYKAMLASAPKERK